jgi:choline kinase
MSKALIITVAGTSSRFRKSLGRDVLKAIYSEDKEPSILDVLLDYADSSFDDIIIVGGYRFDELKEYIEKSYKSKNIILVNNELYSDGSNISLVCGIKALDKRYDEVLFVEGDLVIDRGSFDMIVESKKDTITGTTLPIEAKTSVVYYVNESDSIVYKYDTEHKLLKIDEPFKRINNSGQIWKFCDIDILKEVADSFGDNDTELTNLATVEPYFNRVDKTATSHQQIERWFNCNTIDDYRRAIKYLKEEYEYNK